MPTLAEGGDADAEQGLPGPDPGLRHQELDEEEVGLQDQLVDVEDYLTSPSAQEDFNSQALYLQYLDDQRFQQIVPLRVSSAGPFPLPGCNGLALQPIRKNPFLYCDPSQ